MYLDNDNINKELIQINLIRNNKSLSAIQTNRLLDKLNYIDSKKEYIDTLDDLESEINKQYIKKSSDRLKYFVKNNLIRYNRVTGEIKDYTYNNGVFKYYNDFKYDLDSLQDKTDLDNVKLKFQEHQEGQFLSNADRLFSIKKISKVMYLDYMNRDKEKIFITFTLPNGNYHKYNSKRELTKTYNSKKKLEENISSGLKYLNEIHRYYYHTLKYKIKRYCRKNSIKDKNIINVDFIKMLEPHKSLDGHFHSLFYIDNEFINIAQQVYNMTINHFKLKQTKFELLENAKGSTYLTKYLLKTTKNENLFYNQYKRYFSNVRFFTSSNFRYTTQEKIELVYKYLQANKPKLLQRYKGSNKPIYFHLEKLIKNKIFLFEEVEKTGYTIDNKKINKEYKKTLKAFKKWSQSSYDRLDPNKNYWSFGISEEERKQKLKGLKNIKQIYLKKFRSKIIQNLSDYIITSKYKTIEKMYYKNTLVLNKTEWENMTIESDYFEKLKLNPFESEEIEQKLFNY